MTRRGLGLLAVALASLAIGWGFGTVELSVVGFGLLSLVALALAVTLAEVRGSSLRRVLPTATEAGQTVTIALAVERTRRRAVTRATVIETAAPGGAVVCELDEAMRGRCVLDQVQRGRYVLADARLVCEDPFSLVRRSRVLAARDVLLVRPRVIELGSERDEIGTDEALGRRAIAAASGFDLRGVRAHRAGESLRRVHWPSTARVGRLMVKELEDDARDDVQVLIDCAAVSAASSAAFEVVLEASLAICRRSLASGRRTSLLTLGDEETRFELVSSEQWEAALDALAALRADRLGPIGAGWRPGHGAGAVWLVSCAADRLSATFVAARADAGRIVVVAVDPTGWDEAACSPDDAALGAADAALVVRRGDDLRRELVALAGLGTEP